MTATNHVLTGVVIASVVKQPLVALALAFASHFLLDMLPHFGFPDWQTARKKYRKLVNGILIVDSLLAVSLIFILISRQVPLIVYAGALAAFSPDLVWIHHFLIHKRIGAEEDGTGNAFDRFHTRIQTREIPAGMFIELAYMAVMVFIFVSL